jgi:DNA-binding transcriptional LysR family regulator
MYDDFDYAYEVYKEKSFSQAAKNLYVSQPALSSSIKKLEARFGVTIFDRSSQPISLTDEGKVFIEAIENIKNIKAASISLELQLLGHEALRKRPSRHLPAF